MPVMPVNESAALASANDEVDDLDGDEDDVDQPHVAPRRRRRTGTIVVLGLVSILLVALVIIALVHRRPSATTVTFVDRRDGIALDYPKGWTVQKTAGAAVVLQLEFNKDPLNIVRVSVHPMQQSVNLANLADIRAFTNAIISGTKVQVLQQAAFTTKLNHLPGYTYLYTLQPVYAQPGNQQTAIYPLHSHFFIFPPHEMVELLFQTPIQNFSKWEPQFRNIFASFRTVPTKS